MTKNEAAIRHAIRNMQSKGFSKQTTKSIIEKCLDEVYPNTPKVCKNQLNLEDAIKEITISP